MLYSGAGGDPNRRQAEFIVSMEGVCAMRNLLASVFVVLVTAAPAIAQDERPVSFSLGGGALFPTGGLNDSFNAGWNGGLGVTFNITPTWGVQGEYNYHWMPGPEREINISPTPNGSPTTIGLLESNHHMHAGTFNLVNRINPGRDRKIGGYLLAGGGIFHRTVQITSPSVGYTTYCDPYWYVCYPALVEVDRIVGDRSSNDFGMNFGGGVTFGTDVKFFVETRYTYVWGKDVVPSAGVLPASTTTPTSLSTSASYMPLNFGVRW
jgi:hypothetical protein